ncbi:NAD-dependent epimerase/dehydratase family protein [Candidatus Uabimicrobium amorphum]|uniref:Epimerase n=1 Tax=Uabimicrobium amorphum TaxID=2596890 RepID=A0A5S9IKS0_UABAM|nr:NAD-dependent epimerase/dehydratase family protein [Candidatus Uabimicrobium amorphum]BBM83689.1 epimerase [Candidatus Uabimicrobium amorphum]
MRVLVIGGNGFIGRVLITMLLAKQCNVVNVYRRMQDPLHEGVENICLNRKDIPAFRRRLQGKSFDAVVDLAAFTRKDVEVVNESLRADVYVLISSSAVYGEISSCHIDESTAVSTCQHHKYGHNKIQAEDAVRKRTHVIIRPAVVYGEDDSHEERGRYFFEEIHKDKIAFPGKIFVRNSYIYVEDLACLIVASLLSSKKNVTVNAAGIHFDWDTYLKTMAQVCDVPLPEIENLNLSLSEFRDYAKNNKIRFPHNAFHDFVVNCDLAQKLYDWQPKISLEEGLSRTKKWALGR